MIASKIPTFLPLEQTINLALFCLYFRQDLPLRKILKLLIFLGQCQIVQNSFLCSILSFFWRFKPKSCDWLKAMFWQCQNLCKTSWTLWWSWLLFYGGFVRKLGLVLLHSSPYNNAQKLFWDSLCIFWKGSINWTHWLWPLHFHCLHLNDWLKCLFFLEEGCFWGLEVPQIHFCHYCFLSSGCYLIETYLLDGLSVSSVSCFPLLHY